MKSLWIILFLLVQGTEGFLFQNAKVKLCLQASTTDENLLLEDCNPTSEFQHWSWQDNSLINQGTRKCLSTDEANNVRSSPCESAAHADWECVNFMLHPVGSTQMYLTADKNKATLANTKSPSSRWRVSRGQSVCDQKQAKAEGSRYFAMALTSAQMHDKVEDSSIPEMPMSQEQLQKMLWFFRSDDSSTWNYSILVLSFVVLFLGLLLLGINIMANRNRKIILMCEQAAKPAEPEAKPHLVDLKEDNNLNPFTQDLLPKGQRPGEVLVQWKDGSVTALYAEKSEEDM
ncbi:organic solute transporter subunit beta [Dermochelys coriacea]|uniref:organic solute transporter subunit beta n=1 Tax=Dermochelys coriacea TaxID=27794 RepID=UPI0018E810A2|nr:organic solute transporter subunit beta [Dermochelys coriacea]